MTPHPEQASTRPLPLPAAPRVAIRNDALRPKQQRIALATILIPTAGTVGAIVWSSLRGFTWLDFGFLAVGIVLGQLALEVGFHRLLAHRAFDTARWLRGLLAIGASMTGQGRLLHWVANHRRHHLHSDTPNDPHSPHVRARREGPGEERLPLVRGLIHAQWGHMLTDDVPNGTLFARDLNQDSLMRFINDRYGLWMLLGLLLPTLLGALLAGFQGACSGLLWGGFARMFVVQNVTWSVASLTHRFGSAPFDAGDHSRNLIWTALPSFGSGYQNTHHAFPQSATLGLRWWEPDVAAWVIRGLALIGLATHIQCPSPEQVQAKRRSVPKDSR